MLIISQHGSKYIKQLLLLTKSNLSIHIFIPSINKILNKSPQFFECIQKLPSLSVYKEHLAWQDLFIFYKVSKFLVLVKSILDDPNTNWFPLLILILLNRYIWFRNLPTRFKIWVGFISWSGVDMLPFYELFEIRLC